MKKKVLSIVLIVTLLLCLTGCDVSTVETERKEDNTSMFVCVETSPSWKVVYHKETKVMYVISAGNYNYGTFTLLVDADGKPMLWEK